MITTIKIISYATDLCSLLAGDIHPAMHITSYRSTRSILPVRDNVTTIRYGPTGNLQYSGNSAILKNTPTGDKARGVGYIIRIGMIIFGIPETRYQN